MKTTQPSDVIIVGGGCAGVAAAVSSAKAGLSVTLVERNAFPGGAATAAEVGTVCGLYRFSKNEQSEYIVNGFAKDFAEKLRINSGTEPVTNSSGLHFLPYQISQFKSLCTGLLDEYGVRVMLNAELKGIQQRDKSIESVSIMTGNSLCLAEAGSVIDCSGNAVVSQLAGLPLIESSSYQAAAQVFSLTGIKETSESILGFVLMKALRSAIRDKQLPDFFDRLYVVPGSLKGNTVSLKMGIPKPVTHVAGNLGDLKTTAAEIIHELTGFLIQRVPGFENAKLLHIAPQVGIRVGLRTLGKYVLTEDDVLSGRKFDDAVADVSWPIEEWELDRRVKMRYLKDEDFYQIPAGCLQSLAIDNLFTAGRCLSASNAAIASARVMGVCLQTGYAAGCLAAAYTRNLSRARSLQLVHQTD